jgi:hypothetical protein
MADLELERNGRSFVRMPDGSERLVKYLGEPRTTVAGEPVEPDPVAGLAGVEEIPPFPRAWAVKPGELRRATSGEVARYRSAASIAYPCSQFVPKGG